MADWQPWVFTAIALPALVQFTFWIRNSLIAPAMQRKQLMRQPFRELLELGFSAPSDAKSWHELDEKGTLIALVGTLDGYVVEFNSNYDLGWNWNKVPFYLIRVFFNMENLNNQDLQNRYQQNVMQKHRFPEWSDNYDWYDLTVAYVEVKRLCGRFVQPTGSALFETAKSLVLELQELGLKPVSYEEAKIQWQNLQH